MIFLFPLGHTYCDLISGEPAKLECGDEVWDCSLLLPTVGFAFSRPSWLLFEQYGTSRYNHLLAVHSHQGQCLSFRSLLQTFLNTPPYLNFACEAELVFTRTVSIEPQLKKILTSRLKKETKKMKEITNFFFCKKK